MTLLHNNKLVYIAANQWAFCYLQAAISPSAAISMSYSVDSFNIWLESYISPKYLFGLLVVSSTFYLVARVMYLTVLAPPGTKVPRISLQHVFDFKRLRMRPWADAVDSIRASSEKAGIKAAKHPLEPLFFVWDVGFVDYVVKNPSNSPLKF